MIIYNYNHNKVLNQRLEFFVADHCNLKCTDCSTYSPFLNQSFADFNSFKNDIDKLSPHLHNEIFRFLGGEPLLHPELIKFIQYVKHKNFSNRVGVCTNGILLMGMPDVFFESLDFINISQYDETNIKYQKIKNFLDKKCEELLLTKKHKLVYSFENQGEKFIQYHSDENLGQQKAQENYQTCKLPHVYNCHTFKDGYYYKCSLAIFKSKYYNQKNEKKEFDFILEDGFNFQKENFNMMELVNYVNSDKALATCYYCHGSEGSKNKRKQLTTQEIKFYKDTR